MYQLIGSLLALSALLMTLSDDPLSGAVLALLTFAWVLKANPHGRVAAARPVRAWGAAYSAPYGR